MRVDSGFSDWAELIKAIAGELQVLVLVNLIYPRNVADLCFEVGYKQATVSNALAMLKAHGLVVFDQAGRHHIYRLTDLGWKLATAIVDLENLS